MPRTCTIRRHPKRAEIDAAVVEHRPFRTIARQFSASKDSLIRHHDNHLPAEFTKAKEAEDAAHADTILAQVQDLRVALGAIREARSCLELLGKLAGKLQEGATVNVFVSAEWQTVQAAILAALAPHPDARLAVAEALFRTYQCIMPLDTLEIATELGYALDPVAFAVERLGFAPRRLSGSVAQRSRSDPSRVVKVSTLMLNQKYRFVGIR